MYLTELLQFIELHKQHQKGQNLKFKIKIERNQKSLRMNIIQKIITDQERTIQPSDSLLQVEKLFESEDYKQINKNDWHAFLDYSSRPEYLSPLADAVERDRWAEVVFKIIQYSEYSLLDLFRQRVQEIPNKVLFEDTSIQPFSHWTYKQMNNLTREKACIFHQATTDEPRVAIYSSNSIQSASVDLACLFYDIFDTPLNTHFQEKEIVPIFDRLKINIAVCDTKERLDLLKKIREQAKLQFQIFTLDERIKITDPFIIFTGTLAKKLDRKQIEETLSQRKRFKLNEVATTMFTSGSTGVPKGVSFSIYNLVSKRFARHAALPTVGENEKLLCFLPLFHTFGRYLEMLGSIYWRGTYVFTGNASTDTLLSLFPKIKPTGFISIPLRWNQIYDKCMKKIEHLDNKDYACPLNPSKVKNNAYI